MASLKPSSNIYTNFFENVCFRILRRDQPDVAARLMQLASHGSHRDGLCYGVVSHGPLHCSRPGPSLRSLRCDSGANAVGGRNGELCAGACVRVCRNGEFNLGGFYTRQLRSGRVPLTVVAGPGDYATSTSGSSIAPHVADSVSLMMARNLIQGQSDSARARRLWHCRGNFWRVWGPNWG